MRSLLTILLITSALGLFTPILADDAPELTWEMMKALDSQSTEIPESLQALQNQEVTVKGFIVPLELDEYIDMVRDFLLVSNPLACIHVPPPPPNQIVYVQMEKAIPLDMDFRGVAVTGILQIPGPDATWEEVSFEMTGLSAKEADIEFDDSMMDILDGHYDTEIPSPNAEDAYF